MQVTGYGKQTEWRVSIVTTLTTKVSSSLPFPPSYHTYTLTSLNRDSAYQLEVIYAQIKGNWGNKIKVLGETLFSKVRARNRHGWSPFSSPHTFFTSTGMPVLGYKISEDINA